MSKFFKMPRSYYRLKRGSYMQPALEKSDIRLVIYTTILQVLGRIYDYLTPPPKPPVQDGTMGLEHPHDALEMAETVYPLQVWGVLFSIGALVLIFGLVQRRHLVVWLGHAILTAEYIVLFVALFIPTILYTPTDNYRVFTVLFVPIVIQSLLMMRTGPKPINPKHLVKKEVVGGELEC